MDYDNIFLLSNEAKIRSDENYNKAKREIISILKENHFSLSDSAWMFKRIIQSLGNTPMNEL